MHVAFKNFTFEIIIAAMLHSLKIWLETVLEFIDRKSLLIMLDLRYY